MVSGIEEIAPKVSVVVGAYNHKNYISKCLDSILMQQVTFSFEIILGEDASSDGTREICKAYAEKHSDKIKLFLRSRKDVIYINGNPTGRYNFIENLKACTGTYIALCDGDDYWKDPYKLQKQVQLLENNSNLIACHHWQYIAIEKEGSFVEVEAPSKGHGYFSQTVASVKNIFANQVRMKTRTVMFRNIIDDDFFPHWFYKVAFGDVPLSFLLGKHGDFGFIDEPMAVYRQTNSGISTTGLEELGKKKFKVQHFKNWIQIWDYADKFYGFKYHKEATETVVEFYKTITDNLPNTINSFIKVLYYNIFNRSLPFRLKIASSKWIILYYRKKLGYKLKRKLTTS
ncbi:glycosyltransferase family 2 protein [Gelidibacter japonicus]|uniref:glycosyltransferase family 2 protein n=1 Tax=Gelidibacter japonicus TaxID=1962232 RepID=UPI003A958731